MSHAVMRTLRAPFAGTMLRFNLLFVVLAGAVVHVADAARVGRAVSRSDASAEDIGSFVGLILGLLAALVILAFIYSLYEEVRTVTHLRPSSERWSHHSFVAMFYS